MGMLHEYSTNINLPGGLPYESYKCRTKLIDRLVEEECSEHIDGNELIYNATLNDHGKV